MPEDEERGGDKRPPTQSPARRAASSETMLHKRKFWWTSAANWWVVVANQYQHLVRRDLILGIVAFLILVHIGLLLFCVIFPRSLNLNITSINVLGTVSSITLVALACLWLLFGFIAVCLRKTALTKIFCKCGMFMGVLVCGWFGFLVFMSTCSCENWWSCYVLEGYSRIDLLNPYMPPANAGNAFDFNRGVPYAEPPKEFQRERKPRRRALGNVAVAVSPRSLLQFVGGPRARRSRHRADQGAVLPTSFVDKVLAPADPTDDDRDVAPSQRRKRGAPNPQRRSAARNLSPEPEDSASGAARKASPEVFAPAKNAFWNLWNVLSPRVHLKATDEVVQNFTLAEEEVEAVQKQLLHCLHVAACLSSDDCDQKIMTTMPELHRIILKRLWTCLDTDRCGAIEVSLVGNSLTIVTQLRDLLPRLVKSAPKGSGMSQVVFLKRSDAVLEDVTANDAKKLQALYAEVKRQVPEIHSLGSMQVPSGCRCSPESCRGHLDPQNGWRYWCTVDPVVLEHCWNSDEDIFSSTGAHGQRMYWTYDLCKPACACSGRHLTAVVKVEGETRKRDLGGTCTSDEDLQGYKWCNVGVDSTCPDRVKRNGDGELFREVDDLVMQWSSRVACAHKDPMAHVRMMTAKHRCTWVHVFVSIAISIIFLTFPPLSYILILFINNRCGDFVKVDNQFQVDSESDDDDDLDSATVHDTPTAGLVA